MSFTIFMKSKETINKIVQVYLSLAMESHKKKNISVMEICNRCSIHEQTFYRYFASKSDFFRYIIEHYLFQLNNASENFQDTLKDLFFWLEKNAQMMSSLLRVNDFRTYFCSFKKEKEKVLREQINEKDMLCLDFFASGLDAVFQTVIEGQHTDDSLSSFLSRLCVACVSYKKENNCLKRLD